MAEVQLRPLAESDLLEIWSYLSQFSEDSANQLMIEFDQKFQLLSQTPYIGRLRPELQVENIRGLPHGHYVIYYIPSDEIIDIMRILHSRRDVEPLLSEP